MSGYDYRLEPPDDDGPADNDHEGAEPDVEFDVDDVMAACAAEGAWLAGREWSASQ